MSRSPSRLSITTLTQLGLDPDAELYANAWKQQRLLPPHESRHGLRLRLWKYLLMMLATYNAYVIPMQFAFEVPTKTLADGSRVFRFSVLQLIVQYLLDLAFAFDIFLRFRTSFLPPVEESADPIFDTSRIARRYLRGSFALDSLACFPLDLLAAGAADGGLLSLTAQRLRMNRVLQIARLYTTHRKEVVKLPRVQRLLLLWLIFLLAAHWVSPPQPSTASSPAPSSAPPHRDACPSERMPSALAHARAPAQRSLSRRPLSFGAFTAGVLVVAHRHR